MRRRIAGLLTLALLAALALPAAAAGEQPSAWAQEAVSFAVANGILTEGDVRPVSYTHLSGWKWPAILHRWASRLP